jgi:hypothetical protein
MAIVEPQCLGLARDKPFRDSETALGVVAVAPGGGVARRGQNAPVDSPESLRGYKIASWNVGSVGRVFAHCTPWEITREAIDAYESRAAGAIAACFTRPRPGVQGIGITG